MKEARHGSAYSVLPGSWFWINPRKILCRRQLVFQTWYADPCNSSLSCGFCPWRILSHALLQSILVCLLCTSWEEVRNFSEFSSILWWQCATHASSCTMTEGPNRLMQVGHSCDRPLSKVLAAWSPEGWLRFSLLQKIVLPPWTFCEFICLVLFLLPNDSSTDFGKLAVLASACVTWLYLGR